MKISELTVGIQSQYVSGFVSELEERLTASGEYYVNFRLFDKTDKIEVKVWKTKLEEVESAGIQNGSFVVSRGRCQLFRDKKQFSVDTDGKLYLRLINPEDNIDISEYTPMAPLSYEEIEKFLLDGIEMIEDEELRGFTKSIFDDHREKLISMPGSINVHHEYLNGLGYHLYRMLSSAIALKSVYTNCVNFDYVIAGILLHDIGKLKCYNLTDIGTPEGYTIENSLIGHIPIGLLMIEPYQLSEDKKNLIRHLLLSHHGRPEYGAIVTPMFIEAELLHMIDIMDAKITIMESELNKLDKGEISDRIWSLERARVIKI